jgi:ferredoxin
MLDFNAEVITITPSLNATGTINKNDITGFCYPTHGFNAPPVVIDFFLRFPRGRGRVFLLNTRAGMKLYRLFTPGISGWAQLLPAIIIILKGYTIIGLQPMDLPSNWISVHPGLRRKVVDSIFNRCEAITKRFASKILSGKRVFKGLISLPLDLAVFPVSVAYFFYGRMSLAKTFIAGYNCNKCMICIKECPVNAIRLVDRRPFWSRKCESCMHCMNRCPQKAIQTPHLFVFLIWWFILTAVPFFTLKYILSFLPSLNSWMGLTNDIILLFSALPIVLFTYSIQHFLMRFKCFNWLITNTSLTRLWFWRRYFAP